MIDLSIERLSDHQFTTHRRVAVYERYHLIQNLPLEGIRPQKSRELVHVLACCHSIYRTPERRNSESSFCSAMTSRGHHHHIIISYD